MFVTYLRRELAGRRKQTAIIAIGMALAIALVIIVNAVSSGVQLAQATVLASVYGVGTDITVSQTPAAPTEGEAGAGGRRTSTSARRTAPPPTAPPPSASPGSRWTAAPRPSTPRRWTPSAASTMSPPPPQPCR